MKPMIRKRKPRTPPRTRPALVWDANGNLVDIVDPTKPMIQFTRVPKYTSSNGDQFDTLELAQVSEILNLGIDGLDERLAKAVILNASEFIAILRQSPRVRSSSTRKNGGRKPRRAATATEAKP